MDFPLTYAASCTKNDLFTEIQVEISHDVVVDIASCTYEVYLLRKYIH